MTKQIAALDALIEAVEAGEIDDDSFCPLFHAKGLCREAVNAFNGSLDAAKALHEAVLPVDYIMMSDSTGFADLWRDEFEITHSWCCLIPKMEARARLSCIIRALIAQAEQ